MSNDQFDRSCVIPACLMPYGSNLEVDEAADRRHLGDFGGGEWIAASTVYENGILQSLPD